MGMPITKAIVAALASAALSPCRSKRGVVLFRGDDLIAFGHNDQVEPRKCNGSITCKKTCRMTALHAEQSALLQAGKDAAGCDLVHVKIEKKLLAVSDGPSCVQCSKLIVAAGVIGVWLFHESGWRRYAAQEFHHLSVDAFLRSGDALR